MPSPSAFWVVVVVVVAGAAGSVGCLLSAGLAAAGSAGFVLASVGLVELCKRVCVCTCVSECARLCGLSDEHQLCAAVLAAQPMGELGRAPIHCTCAETWVSQYFHGPYLCVLPSPFAFWMTLFTVVLGLLDAEDEGRLPPPEG